MERAIQRAWRVAAAMIALLLVASTTSEYSLHLCQSGRISRCGCHEGAAGPRSEPLLERATCCSAERVVVTYAAGEPVRWDSFRNAVPVASWSPEVVVGPVFVSALRPTPRAHAPPPPVPILLQKRVLLI